MRITILSGALAAAFAAAAFGPSAAEAQAVDYAALESAFGEPVTTSVTGKPQRASTVPASTIIITRKEIARSPARDIPGLLKTSLGIDVNRWTAGQTDVAVRGGVQAYNSRLLVLVDGRQVYLDHYGMTNWNLLGIQLEQIEQIELVRGAFSALFGFNAATGVVNIITRRADAKASATVGGEVGNHGYTRIGGTLGLPVATGIGVRLTAGHQREDERHVPAGFLAPSQPPAVATDQVSGDVRGAFGRSELVLSGGYAYNRQLEVLPIQIASVQRYKSGNVNAQFKRDTDWGGVSAGSYVNFLTIDFGVTDHGTAAFAPFHIRNRIIVNQGAAIIRLSGASTLRVAAEYRHNRLKSDVQSYRTVSQENVAANATVDVALTDAVSVTLAGRLDKSWLGQSGAAQLPVLVDRASFGRSFTRPSFNAAVLLRMSDADQLRFNGGLAYQLPPLGYYGIQLPLRVRLMGLQAFYFGDTQLSPIPVWTGEATYGRDIGKFRARVTGFYTHTGDAIVTPSQGANPVIRRVPQPVILAPIRSLGSYGSYGSEFSISHAEGAFSWAVKYTWNRTFQDLHAVEPLPYGFSPKDTTPEHKVILKANYTHDRWSLAGVARYTSATRQFAYTRAAPTAAAQLHLLPVEDAVSLDARVAYRLNPVAELFAAGENLTNAGGAAGSPIPADRRMRAGVRVTL